MCWVDGGMLGRFDGESPVGRMVDGGKVFVTMDSKAREIGKMNIFMMFCLILVDFFGNLMKCFRNFGSSFYFQRVF
jgi:hypothetical protein